VVNWLGYFVAKLSRLQQKNVAGVSEEAMAILLEHDYPGNVRELENIVEHAFVLCRTGLIEPRHSPLTLQSGSEHESASAKHSLSLAVLETQHINDALRRHAGNRRAVARELGIHPSTLFRKIKLLDIELPPQDGRSTRVRSGNGSYEV
jgi:transcriptional regulator with PAS, ATPase and Fis domain